MKFTVEVEDFYLDKEDELAPELSTYVTGQVVSQIWVKIEKKVDESVRVSVQAKIEQELTKKINIRIAELIESEKIIVRGQEISIPDYIKSQFEKNSGWGNPDEIIEKKAKEFGAEMKKRYDYFYANQIVQQMHTIGIIKEDIYKNLIEVN